MVTLDQFLTTFLDRLNLRHLTDGFRLMQLRNIIEFLDLTEARLRPVTTDGATVTRIMAAIREERQRRFMFASFRSQYHRVFAQLEEPASPAQRTTLANEVVDYIRTFRDTLRRGEVFGIVSHLLALYPAFASIDNRSGTADMTTRIQNRMNYLRRHPEEAQRNGRRGRRGARGNGNGNGNANGAAAGRQGGGPGERNGDRSRSRSRNRSRSRSRSRSPLDDQHED